MNPKASQSTDPMRCLESLLGVPFTSNNQIQRFTENQTIFDEMLQSIETAEQSILFLSFVFEESKIADRFVEAFESAPKRGVQVFILLDGFGARKTPASHIRRLKEAGCQVTWFRPISWRLWDRYHRTHRKVLVVDRKKAFVGGIGISKEWTEGRSQDPHPWRETHFAIEGPAAWGLAASFTSNWMEQVSDIDNCFWSTEQTDHGHCDLQIVRANASVNWSDIATIYLGLLKLAKKRIWLTTPYFVPGKRFTSELIKRHKEGIDLRVLVPGPYIDSQCVRLASEKYLSQLVEEGVPVHAYQRTVIHTKSLVVDDQICFIGSANFNQRSMRQDDETGIVAFDRDLNETLASDFLKDCQNALQLDSEWVKKKMRLHRKLLRSVISPFERQF